jgi:hypothetical protein
MLRFLADPYDDTCSTVFPFLQVILSSVRILRYTPLPHLYSVFLVQAQQKDFV